MQNPLANVVLISFLLQISKGILKAQLNNIWVNLSFIATKTHFTYLSKKCKVLTHWRHVESAQTLTYASCI